MSWPWAGWHFSWWRFRSALSGMGRGWWGAGRCCCRGRVGRGWLVCSNEPSSEIRSFWWGRGIGSWGSRAVRCWSREWQWSLSANTSWNNKDPNIVEWRWHSSCRWELQPISRSNWRRLQKGPEGLELWYRTRWPCSVRWCGKKHHFIHTWMWSRRATWHQKNNPLLDCMHLTVVCRSSWERRRSWLVRSGRTGIDLSC